MPVTLIAGPDLFRWTGVKRKQTFSQSTATTFQDVNLFVDRVHLGMGTATGPRNLYLLSATAVEGQIVSFLSTATGEAKVLLSVSTATGMWVFSDPDDYLRTIFEDGKWRILISSATLSTST